VISTERILNLLKEKVTKENHVYLLEYSSPSALVQLFECHPQKDEEFKQDGFIPQWYRA
jgi:hypothetical protein